MYGGTHLTLGRSFTNDARENENDPTEFVQTKFIRWLFGELTNSVAQMRGPFPNANEDKVQSH